MAGSGMPATGNRMRAVFSPYGRQESMCLKQILKWSRLIPALCFSAWFVLLLVLRANELETLDARAPSGRQIRNGSSTSILTESGNVSRRYRGPYHRYCHVDGRWFRIRERTPPRPRTPHRIPHVIHQTWDSDELPARFAPWIASWARLHPTWEYWLWTPRDVRALIRQDYPDYAATYDGYGLALSRADAARYFIMHRFGGLYADLDTQCLRPLDPLVDGRSCVFSEETHEHAHLLYRRHPANLITAIFACRPDHPIFLASVRALPYAQRRYGSDVLRATGPFFLDAIYRYYAGRSEQADDDVDVLPPDYLVPTYDASQSYSFEKACANLRANSPAFVRATCDEWNSRRRLINRPTSKSYANHFWIHVILREKHWKTTKAIRIERILNWRPEPAKTAASRKRPS